MYLFCGLGLPPEDQLRPLKCQIWSISSHFGFVLRYRIDHPMADMYKAFAPCMYTLAWWPWPSTKRLMVAFFEGFLHILAFNM